MIPIIDSRGFEQLLQEKKDIIPFYTPEWNPASEKDFGLALLKIFVHMQEEIIRRCNRVPERNFTAFLEMLGIKLLPAQPAKVPVTFLLSKGLSGGVFVPAGTQIRTEETGENPAFTFETTKSFFAAGTLLKEIYCVDPFKDSIHTYSINHENNKEYVLFGGKNVQEHVLYIGHNDLFKVKAPATIQLEFTFASGKGSIDDLIHLTWEYTGKEGNTEFFDTIGINSNVIQLSFQNNEKGEVGEQEVNGIKSCWICCRMKKVASHSNLPVISRIAIVNVGYADGEDGITPDMGFYNTFPLDVSGKFYPFGRQPRLFDTFYIASREAFTKKNAQINITITAALEGSNPAPDDVTLSWEYWNGRLWQLLLESDSISTFTFKCPNDMKETVVNGDENFWIRVRLVNGIYGKDEFEEDPVYGWSINPNFNPPVITEITITYSFLSDTKNDLDYCLVYNNLEYRDVTGESKAGAGGFMPFTPLLDNQPAFYLGFTRAFRRGNINLFFSLPERGNPVNEFPKIDWNYRTKAPNLTKDIFLVNEALNEAVFVPGEGMSVGTELEFEEVVGGEIIKEIAVIESYSENHVIFKNNLFYPFTTNAVIYKRAFIETSDTTGYLTKSGILEFIAPPGQLQTTMFGKECYWLMGKFLRTASFFPLIKGIYLNTVWAENTETIRNEILGNSDGEKNQYYTCTRSPVISPEIWVKEGERIPEDLIAGIPDEDIQEIKDTTGRITETWIKWNIVNDFLLSHSKSRHCIIDNAMGIIQFGDSEHGMIPPIGKNSIKAHYKTGGGIRGNVPAEKISILKTSIAGITSVINHEPGEGGSDTELLTSLFERGTHVIKHRNRAVTIEDFERLAKSASGYIARTKAYVKGGSLKIIIIPKGEGNRPFPSLKIKNIVWNYLIEQSLNTLLPKSLEVIGPFYKEVRVAVDVIPESMDLAVPLEKEILKQLHEYLHPLTGGNEKKGWEFGRGVHISDIYAMLEGIDGVHHVENLALNSGLQDIEIEAFEIVCPGEQRVTMRKGVI